jgi:hypothetical protein
MENASDALVMAGQVLIFIIALTVCISSFTTVKSEVNRIIGEPETIEFAKGENGYGYINYIESRENGSTRVVGAETVISSMYRAVKENYVIYIKLNDYNSIGTTTVTTNATKDVVVNGETKIHSGEKIIKVTIGAGTNQQVNSILKSGFYDKIKDLTFNEYLGEYQNESDATSENKPVYRIITYVQNQ